MTLDRQTPPIVGDIKKPIIPDFTSTELPNGAKLHVMRGGTQQVVKVDVSIPTGHLRAPRTLVAKSAVDLFSEGTRHHTAVEIANELDFYGAYVWGKVKQRQTMFSLMCLQRDIEAVAPLFREMIEEAIYPKEEVELYLTQEQQSFEIRMLKTDFLASRAMTSLLYKPESVYARMAVADDFDTLTTGDLLDYNSRFFRPQDASIFISGLPSDADVRFIADLLSNGRQGGEAWEVPTPILQKKPGRTMLVYDSQQTSVHMCRPIFSKSHEDYMPFMIVDTALGGYFCSRLMQNLREKRGLTYGVSSNLSSSHIFGLHSVCTEVRTGSHNEVVDEIKREMEILCSELISDKEMQTLRGFLLGGILRMFDCVFSSAETVHNLLLDGYTTQRVVDFYDLVCNVTPSTLRDVARRWLDPDAYNVVCVGKGVR